MRLPAASLVGVIAATVLLASCGGSTTSSGRAIRGADAARGSTLISAYGCGACHTIGGIANANATVGPPLTDLSKRLYIAGILPNTTDNLIRWIRYPQSVYPGNVMPNMGVSDRDARDIAAYLYQH